MPKDSAAQNTPFVLDVSGWIRTDVESISPSQPKYHIIVRNETKLQIVLIRYAYISFLTVSGTSFAQY